MTSLYERSIGRAFEILGAAPRLKEEGERVRLAIELASALLEASAAGAETHERERAARLAALLDDPVGQAFVSALTDRAHRSASGERLLTQVKQLVRTLGVPQSFSSWDRLELRALRLFGTRVPELTARAVRRRIDEDAAPYLAPADPARLDAFLAERRALGMAVNVNHLGEEVLGQADAARMLETYVELLERPAVDTISVKLSSIDSRIDLIAWQKTLERLAGKLERIYRAALGAARIGPDDAPEPKLVYLDMEAYRDLELTVELFCRVLAEPEFQTLTAGIVLQAYLPDSHLHQTKLVAWARERVARGGAPIRMRLVKGANLMMERIDSSMSRLALPTYGSKHEVDASFKRMLRFGTLPENAHAVRLGIGSHNLFDIAYTLVSREHHGVAALVEPEMLEGMADPLRRVIARVAGRVLVYAPSVDDRDFPSAVAYLVRRLDENTAEGNFLRRSFAMGPGDRSFAEERERFVAAVEAANAVNRASYRTQDRSSERQEPPAPSFANEPDTDFTRPAQRSWLRGVLERADRHHGVLSSRVAAETLGGNRRPGFDPSRPGVVPYEVALLDRPEVTRAIGLAERAGGAWAAVADEQREELLLAVAARLRRARGELLGVMLLDSGKRVIEADAEISEAIDFAEYYARQHRRLREHFVLEAKGLTVVTPPWNFPLATGLGSTLAALVAGNPVLLKPPPETPLVLARAAEICWDAGVPAEALGFVLTEDAAADALVTDARVRQVLLTGGTDTARLFRRVRPELELVAETGGKNAMIVSAMSDREQAITHAVRSAFGHAGQKCSALSLLILEREVFRSASFQEKLADAVSSLTVGSAWDPESFVTPLIRPPTGALARALSELHEGERWLVAPSRSADNERLVGPGVRWGVEAGSFTHQNELFGPVLGVMEARDFEHALELANTTPYGLTAGLESLDAEEQEGFLARMNAGNLYVNRPITGAIVGRQPFGGRKASSFGAGFKAGGPNTLLALVNVLGERPAAARDPIPLSRGPRAPIAVAAARGPSRRTPADLGSLGEIVDDTLRDAERSLQEKLARRLRSYERAFHDELHVVHAQDEVLGHEDVFVYQHARVAVIALVGTTELDLLSALVAARMVRAPVELFVDERLHGALAERIAAQGATRFATIDDVLPALAEPGYDRLRLLDPDSNGASRVELARIARSVESGPVSDAGYVELRRYALEQSRSIAHHRYGNLSLYWAREAARAERAAKP